MFEVEGTFGEEVRASASSRAEVVDGYVNLMRAWAWAYWRQ